MGTNGTQAGRGGEMSTIEVARALDLAVRSVQLMVDRGELDAWKTPGGHRRISRCSVERWLQQRGCASAARLPPSRQRRVLLIEDSVHFQNMVSLVLKHVLPDIEFHVASDGIGGLAMAGELKPQVLLVDVLLPGIDGAALISGLRTSPQFHTMKLIVVTSLTGAELAPFQFALAGVPVVHKSRLEQDLCAQVQSALEPC